MTSPSTTTTLVHVTEMRRADLIELVQELALKVKKKNQTIKSMEEVLDSVMEGRKPLEVGMAEDDKSYAASSLSHSSLGTAATPMPWRGAELEEVKALTSRVDSLEAALGESESIRTGQAAELRRREEMCLALQRQVSEAQQERDEQQRATRKLLAVFMKGQERLRSISSVMGGTAREEEGHGEGPPTGLVEVQRGTDGRKREAMEQQQRPAPSIDELFTTAPPPALFVPESTPPLPGAALSPPLHSALSTVDNDDDYRQEQFTFASHREAGVAADIDIVDEERFISFASALGEEFRQLFLQCVALKAQNVQFTAQVERLMRFREAVLREVTAPGGAGKKGIV